jgi:hypothetical protein
MARSLKLVVLPNVEKQHIGPNGTRAFRPSIQSDHEVDLISHIIGFCWRYL